MENEEEEKKAREEKEAEEATAKQNSQNKSGVSDEGEELDEKGVPYKNRYAESERKREQLKEELEDVALRLSTLESRPQSTQTQKPEEKTSQGTSKTDMDEMIRLGPKAYNEKIAEEVQKKLMQKQKVADAENLIKDKFGTVRLQYGVTKVLDYAIKNLIDVNSDPVRAVTKILSEMDKPKTQPSAEERKRTAEAIKNKPESRKQTPPVKTDKSSELMKKVYERGSVDDVAAALQEQWDQESKK